MRIVIKLCLIVLVIMSMAIGKTDKQTIINQKTNFMNETMTTPTVELDSTLFAHLCVNIEPEKVQKLREGKIKESGLIWHCVDGRPDINFNKITIRRFLGGVLGSLLTLWELYGSTKGN